MFSLFQDVDKILNRYGTGLVSLPPAQLIWAEVWEHCRSWEGSGLPR